jgi:hypothetical protein
VEPRQLEDPGEVRVPSTIKGIKKATYPGEVISVDQLESSIPGFIGQMTGKLTRQRIVASTIFLDHASDFSYVYHQTSMTSEGHSRAN